MKWLPRLTALHENWDESFSNKELQNAPLGFAVPVSRTVERIFVKFNIEAFINVLKYSGFY
jgi:hypothetical protein